MLPPGAARVLVHEHRKACTVPAARTCRVALAEMLQVETQWLCDVVVGHCVVWAPGRLEDWRNALAGGIEVVMVSVGADGARVAGERQCQAAGRQWMEPAGPIQGHGHRCPSSTTDFADRAERQIRLPGHFEVSVCCDQLPQPIRYQPFIALAHGQQMDLCAVARGQ